MDFERMNRWVSRLVSLSWMDRHHENEQCPANGFGRNTAADQPSNENRPAIREVAEEFGLTTFESQDLVAATRRFEEITGTKVAYFKGGDSGIAGFTPPSRPNLIAYHGHQIVSIPAAKFLGIELVRPRNPDHAAEGDFQTATGLSIAYFRGGKRDRAGIVSRLLSR
jgi:hypothetical protein